MDSDLNEIASELSHVWLQAISVIAGGKYTFVARTTDSLGIDAEVKFQGNISSLEHAQRFVNINFQLKSTYSTELQPGQERFSIPIESNQFNKYVEMSQVPGTPFILAVLVLPPGEKIDEWLDLEPEQLILKKCMFWTSLYNFEKTDNASQKNVVFLTQNRLTPQSLRDQIVIPCAEGRFGNEL